MSISIQVEGEDAVRLALGKVIDSITDLRPAWKEAKRVFREIETDQFQSSGAAGASGKWKPLSKAYEAQKIRKFGTFALLAGVNIRTERLYKSLRGDTADSVYTESPQEMTIGTSVPYAKYVQKARPVISLSDKQKQQLGLAIKKSLRSEVRKSGLVMTEGNFTEIG